MRKDVKETITSFIKITDELRKTKERIMDRKRVVDAEEIKVKLSAFSDTIVFTIAGDDTWSLLQESAHLASAAIILGIENGESKFDKMKQELLELLDTKMSDVKTEHK